MSELASESMNTVILRIIERATKERAR